MNFYVLYNRSTGKYEGAPQHHTSLQIFDLNRRLFQAGDIRRWVPHLTSKPASETYYAA